MLGTYFYHEIMRKTVIAFGTVFNDINVRHQDKTGKDISTVRVPIAYGPRQKFLARLQQQPDLNKAVQITLPRMSFEMTSMSYDASRKSSITRTFKAVDSTDPSNKKAKKVYLPVPYNIGFELNVMTKLNDDALQIVEQILPFFQPDYTFTLNDMADMGIKRDVPIILNDVGYEDNYQGDFESRRAIIYTMGFTTKFYLYGPVTSSSVIKTVQVDQYADLPDKSPTREQRYTVTPDPTTADADDDFGFNETTSFFTDSKQRDATSGKDVE